MKQLVETALAFFTHDLREEIARPARIAARAATAATALVVIVFAGSAFGAKPDAVWSDTGFFSWFALGYALLGLVWVTLASFRIRVVRYRQRGLLEACALTRTPLWKILLVIPGYDVAVATVGVGCVGVLALMASASPVDASDVAIAIAYFVGGLVPMTALGILATGALLTSRFGSLAERAVRALSTVACGALVPREVLPTWLASVGEWLPLGALLDGIRLSLFGASDAWTVSPLVRMAVLSVVLVPVAVVSARAAIARALLGGYLAPHPNARHA